MKAVEVRVRDAAGLSAKEIGKDLMRKAFDVNSGPLTDMQGEPAERQARSDLFAGAMGSYKNPHSHRNVALDDPGEAAEIIMLANHLLRIVDARAAARSNQLAPVIVSRAPALVTASGERGSYSFLEFFNGPINFIDTSCIYGVGRAREGRRSRDAAFVQPPTSAFSPAS